MHCTAGTEQHRHCCRGSKSGLARRCTLTRFSLAAPAPDVVEASGQIEQAAAPFASRLK